MSPLDLLLHEITLRVDPVEGELAVVSGAALVDGGAEPPDDLSTTPGFELGFGTLEPVPPEIVERFGDVFEPGPASPGMWISSNARIDGTDAPAWYAVFNSEGVDLWGVEAMPAGAVAVPGLFELGAVSVRIAVRVRGAAVQAARFELSGSARCTADLAGIGLAAADTANPDGTVDGEGSFRLAVDVDDVAALDTLIDDPGVILDNPFWGRLHLELGYSGVAFPGGQLPATHVTIDATTHSEGEGDLTLDRLAYRQVSSGSLTIGALDIADPVFEATIEGWSTDDDADLDLRGSASVTLPPFLDDSTPRTGFDTELRFRRDETGIRFDLAADRIVLDPAVNLLGLSNTQLTLVAILTEDDDWELRVRGSAVQSWERVARRLRSAGLRLHVAPGFPHLLAELELLVADDGDGEVDIDVAIDLRLVEPVAGGADPVPYVGPLGFLPVDIRDVNLHLSATVDDGELVAWQASGGGALSSGPALRPILDVRDLTIDASIGLSNDVDPGDLMTPPADHVGEVELALRIANLPPVIVPPLDPAGDPFPLLVVDELTVWLSDRLEVTAGVRLAPELQGDGLADAIGAHGWDDFFVPLGEAIGNLRGWFRIIVPFDDTPTRAEVELKPGSPAVFDLAQLAVDIADAMGTAIAPALPEPPSDDPTMVVSTPDPPGGRQVDGDVALLEPIGVRFVAELGTTTTLSLSASALMTVMGEEFDAVLTVALVNGMPELSLLAGVDDPIAIGLSAADLAGATTSADVPVLVDSFGVGDRRNEVIAGVAGLQDALLEYFSAPGMDIDLGFEIRNLGLTFRPSDGERMLRIGGAIRPTQLPGWLEDVLPGGGPSAVLSTSTSSVRIELQMPGADDDSVRVEPLFEFDFNALPNVDTAESEILRFTLRSLMVEYDWTANAVRVGWDLGIDLPHAVTNGMVDTIGSGIALPDMSDTHSQLATSGKFGVIPIPGLPPIPTVEWAFTAGDPADITHRGLEFVVGIPGQRFLTVFSRQFSLLPTFQMGYPAVLVDGGMIVGNPPAELEPDPNEFFLQAEVQGGVIQITPAPLGVMINPFAVIPPYLTPQPPYWIYPPTYMADLFADAVIFRFNIPGVLAVDAELRRPVPSLDLPALLELGLLALSGFDVDQIPEDSAIRSICYLTLDVNARLPVVELLGGDETPTLDLIDLEVNAADLLELAIRLVNQVQDTVQTGADLMTVLLNDPDRIVAAIPPAARQFRGESVGVLELGGFSLSGSLCLLTSDELLDELVLFHESARRRRRGVAALDDPCRRLDDPHDDPVVTDAQLAVATGLQWGVHRDARRATPTSPLWTTERGRAARSLQAAVDRRDRAVNVLEGQRRKPVLALAARLAEMLAETDDLAAFIKGLRGHTPLVEHVADAVQATLDDLSVPVGRRHDRRRFNQASRGRSVLPRGDVARARSGRRADLDGIKHDELAKKIAGHLIDAPAFVVGGGLDPAELAERLAELVFLGRRAGRSRWKVEILKFEEWGTPLEKVTGIKLQQPSNTFDLLLEVYLRLEARVGGRSELSTSDYQSIVKQLVDDLGRMLDGLPLGRLLSARELSDAVGAGLLGRRFDSRWTWDDRTTVRTTELAVFDGTSFVDTVAAPLDAVDGLDLDPGGPETVERPAGWHVVVADQLDPPLDVALSPPLIVPSPRAELTIRFRGGEYQIVIRAADGSELTRTVPDAVLAHPEAGAADPGRLDRLRSMFRVAERRVVEVVQRPAEEVCAAPHLYQDSLFARSEYVLDPRDDSQLVGIHGPLTLGDLLRDPTTGEYVAVSGPTLVAGMVAELPIPGSDPAAVGLMGLVAPSVTPGSNGAPPKVDVSAFLDGYGRVALPLPGGIVAEIEGSFSVRHGDLWPPHPDQPEGDFIAVDGSITLRHGTDPILIGTVEGRLIRHGDRVELDLDVTVVFDIDVEVEIAGVDLARLWTIGGGGSLEFGLSATTGDGGQLNLSGAASGLRVAFAQLEIEHVEIAPATTICTWVPKLDQHGLPVFESIPEPPYAVPVFEEVCVTTPAVTMPVPTIGQLGEPVAIEAEVVIVAGAAGLAITLTSTAGPTLSHTFDDLMPGL